jgi:hypothetical protein
LLREGQEAVSYLCNIDEESEVHIVASWWLNVYRTGLKIFEKKLTLDDDMTKDEVTQAGAEFSRATDESRSSKRRHRR